MRPSAVTPSRSSRKIVTTRRISSEVAGTWGRASAVPSSATRRATMAISSSAVAGSGRTTVLNRRRSALDSSLMPRSRSLAVAIRLNPWTAATSVSSSGTGRTFSDRIVTRASCTSDGMRVSSSMRTSRPARIARYTGLGTRAASLGPSASRRA